MFDHYQLNAVLGGRLFSSFSRVALIHVSQLHLFPRDLLYLTGQFSEILALHWEHFDFEKGFLLVQKGVVNGRVGNVKTQASKDQVPLDPAFAEILLRHKGDATEGLVFMSQVTGRCYYAGIIQRQILKPRGESVGIVGLGWHTFRHTYRSLLDETGAPIGVQQKLMRHANVSTTMNVYGNSTLRAKKLANSKVVQMMISQTEKEAAA